ncbi:unnamed protein product [Prunus brigantina]
MIGCVGVNDPSCGSTRIRSMEYITKITHGSFVSSLIFEFIPPIGVAIQFEASLTNVSRIAIAGLVSGLGSWSEFDLGLGSGYESWLVYGSEYESESGSGSGSGSFSITGSFLTTILLRSKYGQGRHLVLYL